MNTPPRLKYTSIRTRVVDGRVLIGLKHTATAAADMPITTPWIEMTTEDAEGLVRKIQEALAESSRLPS